MTPVTIDDRRNELRALLNRIRAFPSQDWTRERQRVVVLNHMVTGRR
ncbi:MAG: hypothetical protein AB7U35_10580 [Sphingobium sp.]